VVQGFLDENYYRIRGHPFMTSTRKGGVRLRWGEGKRHVNVHTENWSPLTSSCFLLMQRLGVFSDKNFVFGLE